MDANRKLLKKKRVAHSSSMLPQMGYEEQKLPADDFVYNIMKDMDKQKNVISYQQLQEFKSQKKPNESQNEISNYHKSFQHTKKILPKKTFPLMKKCRTSLNHLQKNRCIPKPRAHVGFVPKPLSKPILNIENNIEKFQLGGSSNVAKTKQTNNESKSSISQPHRKVGESSNSKSHVNKDTVNRVEEKASTEDQLSSSDDDDDDAFEHFVQKVNEKDSDSSDSDSSDSDSRLIIRRKRRLMVEAKSKLKKKKSKPLSSDNEVNKRVAKITSRLLSDSSESEGQERFGVVKNNSTLSRTPSQRESPMRLKESTKENFPDEVTYNSNLSEEDPQEFSGLNYDSSSSESSNPETPASCLLPVHLSQSFDHAELRSCENIKKTKATNSSLSIDKSQIDSGSNACWSEPTKVVPKCDIPCYVRLLRDPEIDKKAMMLYSTILPTSNVGYSSDDDCIVISENSDNERIPEVPKSPTNSTNIARLCQDTVSGNSDVMCEMPNQGLDPQSGEPISIHNSLSSNPLINKPETNSEVEANNLGGKNNLSNSNHQTHQIGLAISDTDLRLQNSHIERDTDDCVVVCEKSIPDAQKIYQSNDSSISDEIVNSDNFSLTTNNDDTNNYEIQDFNVKIVEVHSLTELDEPLVELNAPEPNDVEVIDLSDDDSQVPDIQEKGNATNVNITGVSEPLTVLHQNESPVKDKPKILEILDKFDFEAIKLAISNLKVEESKSESSEIEESSTCSNVLPSGTSLPMRTSWEDIISKDINSTNKLAFRHPNSEFDKNKVDNLKASFELTLDKTISQVRNLNEVELLESVNNIAPTCATDNNVKDFHTSHQILKETESFQEVNYKTPSTLVSKIITNESGMLPLHSKQNSKYMTNNLPETSQNHRDTVCNNLKTTELLTKATDQNYQQDSNTVSKTTTSQMIISNKGKVNAFELVDKQNEIAQGRNEGNIQNLRIKHPIKKETVIESPSDELDVLAASYINDLIPTNKKALAVYDLYKLEYEKYVQIKNTEMNVSAGLNLLLDKQASKLKHLGAAIKNLAKHDACFYKVNQEDCCKVKTSMKNEIKDDVAVKKENPENSKELRCGGSEESVQVTPKSDSAGPSREKILRSAMDLKCAQCGKPATARCQGCLEIFYCSHYCGEQSWRQGHYAVCKKT